MWNQEEKKRIDTPIKKKEQNKYILMLKGNISSFHILNNPGRDSGESYGN